MSELGIFILPSELGSFQKTIADCGLFSHRCVRINDSFELLRENITPANREVDRKFCLLTSEHHNISFLETRHVINLLLPICLENALCMASISIAKPLDYELLSQYNNNIKKYKILVDMLKSIYHVGIFGSNIKTGRTAWYSDIVVSPAILSTEDRFLKLKPSFGDTNVEFRMSQN